MTLILFYCELLTALLQSKSLLRAINCFPKQVVLFLMGFLRLLLPVMGLSFLLLQSVSNSSNWHWFLRSSCFLHPNRENGRGGRSCSHVHNSSSFSRSGYAHISRGEIPEGKSPGKSQKCRVSQSMLPPSLLSDVQPMWRLWLLPSPCHEWFSFFVAAINIFKTGKMQKEFSGTKDSHFPPPSIVS